MYAEGHLLPSDVPDANRTRATVTTAQTHDQLVLPFEEVPQQLRFDCPPR
jgi:hypothetical protein